MQKIGHLIAALASQFSGAPEAKAFQRFAQAAKPTRSRVLKERTVRTPAPWTPNIKGFRFADGVYIGRDGERVTPKQMRARA